MNDLKRNKSSADSPVLGLRNASSKFDRILFRNCVSPPTIVWGRNDVFIREGVHSRVPVSLLNPEGKILIFYGSFGVTANFAMVPNFEESAKKSTRELVKWVVLASSAQNSG